MSAAREWALGYDRSSSGPLPPATQKPLYCKDYYDGTPHDKSSLNSRHHSKSQAATNTLTHTLYSGESALLTQTQHSVPSADFTHRSSRLSSLSNLAHKPGSTAYTSLDYLNSIPDVYHPEGLSYQHVKNRDQDQVLSQQDMSAHRWPGYSNQHVVRENAARAGRGSTSTAAATTLDLAMLARSTPSALEEFLRPTDSITFPPTHFSQHAARTHGSSVRKAAQEPGVAVSRMDRSYSEPIQDDVPCRDQTVKAALSRPDSMPLQDVRPNLMPTSHQSWTIGTGWAAGGSVHESRRPFAQQDTTRTLAPLSWLLNDDTRSTSSSSSSASSDSESGSSNSASLWLSDCPSLGSDGTCVHHPHPPSTAVPAVKNGRSSSHNLLSNNPRSVPDNNADTELSYNQTAVTQATGCNSHLQQRYLLRPWLSAADAQGGKPVGVSGVGLHSQPSCGTQRIMQELLGDDVGSKPSRLSSSALLTQPATATCTQRIMQEFLRGDGASKSGRSSSSSWLSETRGSSLPATSDDQLVTTSKLYSTKQLISPGVARSPSQYQDLSCPLALELANELLACIKLPGNFQYVPVSEDSPLYMLGVVYEFTAFDVALGSTYYQRLRHGFGNSSLLMDRLLGSPQIPGQARLAPVRRYLRQEQLSQLARKQAFLSVLQYISLLLAAKVLGSRTDLSSETLRMHISRAYQMQVQLDKAVDVEVLCLQKLRWRLGPFLEEDQLGWLSSLEWL